MKAKFTARPLDEHTWADLESLFGRPGGSIVRGCWCMFYRKTGAGSSSIAAAAGNKEQLRDLVDAGTTPGLVGYLDDDPVGWISLGPREDYLKLRRSPVMKPVDDAEVWSIVCTYVDKAHRGLGVQHRLLGGRDRLRPRQRSSPARGLPGRQARAQPRRLHVLRLAEPLRASRVPRGRTAIPHPRRHAAPPSTETPSPLSRPVGVPEPAGEPDGRETANSMRRRLFAGRLNRCHRLEACLACSQPHCW